MEITDYYEESIKLHEQHKGNTVAVVSDGSSVMGLGNIGGVAALPLIESKALLLKEFAEIDAFPICLTTQDTDEIVNTIKNISPSFGGICLDSIAAPGCFEIEKTLKEDLDIPVFFDSGQGTASVVGAAVINVYRFLKKPLKEVRTVVCGAGAAGNPIVKTLIALGVRDIVVCDSKGILCASRIPEFGEDKLELIELTNKDGLTGGLQEAVKGRNLFIGVSKEGTLDEAMIKAMSKNPVIIALSTPTPEILPDVAIAAGARIVFTGRSDLPNYISNALIYPGLFKGALEAEASKITDRMVFTALHTLADLISDKELSEDNLLPSVFREGLSEAIAKDVSIAWKAK